MIVASMVDGNPWVSVYDVNGQLGVTQVVTVAEGMFQMFVVHLIP